MPPKNSLPEAVAKIVISIFNRRGNPGFLEGCKIVSDQNANESFSKVLWTLCSKKQFNSPMATTSVCKDSDTCSQRECCSRDKERMLKGTVLSEMHGKRN